ncbi:hypothetical protein CsatB_023084 [Cannabis sativa]
MVSHLITDERVWNVPLLQQWFSPLDVDRILTLPLSFFQHSNALIWHYTTSGAYTVQSGYHLATSIADASANNCSSSVSQASWWKYSWSLQLPQKVKIFASRVIHIALPVATSLVRQNIITDSTCSVCKSAWESIGHALFGCKYAKAVWRHMDLVFDWSKTSAMYKGDYLVHLSTIYKPQEMEQIICTLWSIWTERNRVVHGSSAKPASILASFAVNYLSNFRSATKKYHTAATSAPTLPTSAPGATKWTPLTGLNLKLNVDAALDANRNIVGVGVVVRNSAGHVLAAMVKLIISNFASHIMEAKAMFHSLNWVIQLQLPITIVETDALLVANALQYGSTAIFSYHDILLDVTSLLSFFPQVNVVHAKRSANMVAHSLAKFALGVEETCFWLEDLPLPFYSVVVNDIPV